MNVRVATKTIYSCSLERAFKTPMLCDVSKVHTGYGLMPRVTHCTEDEHWGKPGFSKKIYVAQSLAQKGGFAAIDKVIERVENHYWKIEISNIQSWIAGINKLEGEWKTEETEPGKVLIQYTYTFHSENSLLLPFYWLFANTFWKAYMKRVLENVRRMIINQESYLYD